MLATLEFLAVSGLKPTVSALKCGHSDLTTEGNVSEHSTGDAVDISEINGIPIAGHQGPGSITDTTIRKLLTLQGSMKPHQIISLMSYPGADNTLAMADHYNHIHVGFRPLVAAERAALAGSLSSSITPSEWIKLIARLGEIPDPKVSSGPSAAAIPVHAGAAHGRGELSDGHDDSSQPARGAASGQPPPRAGAAARAVASCRPLAVGALVFVVLIVAYIVFAGGGSSTYKLEFNEADQLVRGDQVQVGGVPVGSIKDIELTHDFKALVTINVDSSLAPLHAGTVAQVRVPSLSSVANRYVALSPGPNNAPALSAGAKLPASATQDVTDLDQLFNTLNPKTRKGLQGFIQGTAEQYVGQGKTLGRTRPNTSLRRCRRPTTSSPSSCATSRRSRTSSSKRPRR